MDGDDLEELTGREVYSGYRVGEIRPAGRESLLEVKYAEFREHSCRWGRASGAWNQTPSSAR